MSIQAGVGMSHHRNPMVAGQEAAKQALAAAGIDKPDFVFMFATVGYNQETLVHAVRQATNGVPLCGCSGEGVIAMGDADESNFAVGVMAIRSDQLRFSHGVVTGLWDDPTGVGCAIGKAIQPEVSSDTLALFLFPDGTTINFDRLVAGMEGQLNVDRPLPLLGGVAGDAWEIRRTYQYDNDQAVSDGVAWALLSGEAHIAWAVNHNCVPIGLEYKVTRSERNRIYEIDGRPALEVLRDYLTDEQMTDWSRVILSFPFGLKVSGDMQDYDEYIIRSMGAGRDDTTGSVMIATEVPEGTRVWLTRRDHEKLASGVERAADEIKARLGGKPAKLVFQFDCAGRGKIFLREEQKLQLLETLRGQIGPDVPWLGFYSFGEIAPVGRHNYFHQYTVALTAIY